GTDAVVTLIVVELVLELQANRAPIQKRNVLRVRAGDFNVSIGGGEGVKLDVFPCAKRIGMRVEQAAPDAIFGIGGDERKHDACSFFVRQSIIQPEIESMLFSNCQQWKEGGERQTGQQLRDA